MQVINAFKKYYNFIKTFSLTEKIHFFADIQFKVVILKYKFLIFKHIVSRLKEFI